MGSKIEQRIDEIEDYIDGCKYLTFSKTDIRVNKDEIDELLRDLRTETPDEIKRYQKIIDQREAILKDAKQKAQALIDKATEQTTELISENEIMQQAYAQANEVITMANKKGQQVLDNATIEANQLKESAQQYLEDVLTHLNDLITSTMNTTNAHYESFYNALSSYNEAINNDMAEIHPPVPDDSDVLTKSGSDQTDDDLIIDDRDDSGSDGTASVPP